MQSAAVRRPETPAGALARRMRPGHPALRAGQQVTQDRRLRQGSWAWPQHNGVEGPSRTGGPAGCSTRRSGSRPPAPTAQPAFSPKLLAALSPRFVALANELIDGFAPAGRCDFVSDFAEPYAARVIAIMLGIPEQEWPKIAEDSATLGLALGVTLQAGTAPHRSGAGEFCSRMPSSSSPIGRPIRRTTSSPALVQAQRDDDRMTHQELLDSLALLIFGGFDTTRNQLGLAIKTFLDHPDQWKLLAEHPEPAVQPSRRSCRSTPPSPGSPARRSTTSSSRGWPSKPGRPCTLFQVRRDRPAHG